MTLCALLLLSQAQAEPDSLNDFWSAFRRPGWKVDVSEPGTNGRVKCGSLDFAVQASTLSDGVTVKDASVGVQFLPQPALSNKALSVWRNDNKNWDSLVDLDGSVSISGLLVVADPKSTECRRLIESVVELVKNVKVLPVPDTFRVSEDIRVQNMTPRDMTLLAKQWGWEYKPGIGGGSGVWMCPYSVDGVLVYGFLNTTNRDEAPEFWLRAQGSRPKRLTVGQWTVLANQAGRGLAHVTVNDDSASYMTSFSLKGGVTLRTIKESIRSFARKVGPVIMS